MLRDIQSGKFLPTVQKLICANPDCGNEFRPKKKKQRFCSHVCATNSYHIFLRKGESKKCKQCGKGFYINRKRVATSFFCSRKCRGDFKIGVSRSWEYISDHYEMILTKNGDTTLVCACHFPQIKKNSWGLGKRGYAVGFIGGKIRPMHRVILNLLPGEIGDHINRNKLDNRCCNLRKATHAQNAMNSNFPKNATGFRGVFLNKRGQRYVAKIARVNKPIWIGTFDTPEEAARAYDKKAKEIYGEYAYQNFPN